MTCSECDLLIRRATDLARWAPSSHNAQPWHLTIMPSASRDERVLQVSLDSRRRLTALSSLDLEMELSIGMFTGVLVTALTQLGMCCALQWAPANGNLRDGENAMVTVRARLSRHPAETISAWTTLDGLVRGRRTVRVPYDHNPPAPASVAAMLARSWPKALTGEALEIHTWMDTPALQAVAGLVERYAALDFNHWATWSETYRHIRFCPPNDAAVTTGFFIDSLLGPLPPFKRRSLQVMLVPLAMQALRPFGAARRMARALAELFATGPGVICAILPDERPGTPALIQAGARLMEIWLKAHAAGIAIHPVSVLLQHDVPRRALGGRFGFQGRPVFLARFGSAPLVSWPPGPRLPVDAILTPAGAPTPQQFEIPRGGPWISI